MRRPEDYHCWKNWRLGHHLYELSYQQGARGTTGAQRWQRKYKTSRSSKMTVWTTRKGQLCQFSSWQTWNKMLMWAARFLVWNHNYPPNWPFISPYLKKKKKNCAFTGWWFQCNYKGHLLFGGFNITLRGNFVQIIKFVVLKYL